MRKIYLSTYLIIFLSLFITSCNQDNEEVIIEADKVAIEPDFMKNDGSMDEAAIEEEAPVKGDLAGKSYYYNNYSLLKPSGLKQLDVDEIKCGETKTMPLLVGPYKKRVGKVMISNDDENLYITVRANENKYMKKVYFYIGEKSKIPFYSNGFPNLYQFNYKAFPYYYGGQKKATYVIPLSSIDSDCFEVVAYSKIFDKDSWCYYSAFAYNKEQNQKYYYSYYTGCYYFGEWVRSFEYCKQNCETYDSAFGKGVNENCFINDGFNKWGWTNGPILGGQRLSLFINADNCDPSVGEFVGWVSVKYYEEDKRATVRFWIPSDSDYVFHNTYVYLGTNKYPLDANGNQTIDPKEYPNSHVELGGVKTDETYIFENVTEDFYVIANASVAKQEE